jgi:predicted amidophosphoribosyltransferase
MWLESVRSCPQQKLLQTIQSHVDTVLTDQSHALNDICVQFALEFSNHYSRERLSSPTLDEHQHHLQATHQKEIRSLIEQATTDINTFIEKLLQVLFNKYWAYGFDTTSSECEQVVFTSILRHIFSIGVYTKLLTWYGRLHKYQNDTLNQKMLEFSDITLRHLKVKRLFRLSDQYEKPVPYQSVIDQLRNYDVAFTIDEKLKLLTSVIDDISVVAKEYYKNDPTVTEDDVVLGADDMLPIFVVSL